VNDPGHSHATASSQSRASPCSTQLVGGGAGDGEHTYAAGVDPDGLHASSTTTTTSYLDIQITGVQMGADPDRSHACTSSQTRGSLLCTGMVCRNTGREDFTSRTAGGSDVLYGTSTIPNATKLAMGVASASTSSSSSRLQTRASSFDREQTPFTTSVSSGDESAEQARAEQAQNDSSWDTSIQSIKSGVNRERLTEALSDALVHFQAKAGLNLNTVATCSESGVGGDGCAHQHTALASVQAAFTIL